MADDTAPGKEVEMDILCRDRDSCCDAIDNKVRCWLHAPELGICPYLFTRQAEKDGKR